MSQEAGATAATSGITNNNAVSNNAANNNTASGSNASGNTAATKAKKPWWKF